MNRRCQGISVIQNVFVQQGDGVHLRKFDKSVVHDLVDFGYQPGEFGTPQGVTGSLDPAISSSEGTGSLSSSIKGWIRSYQTS